MTTPDELVACLFALEPGPPVATIAAALGVDADALAELVVEAEALGLAEGWEVDGPDGAEASVLPSPLACERAGLKLVNVDEGRNVWAWLPLAWEPPRREKVARRPGSEISADWLDGTPSDLPGPPESAEDSEAWESEARWVESVAPRARAERRPIEVGRLPEPRYFLGSTSRWDGPTPAGQCCPVCRGRRLASLEFCLKCGRSGLDHLLPLLVQKLPPVRPGLLDGLAGGVGKARSTKKRRGCKAA